MGKAPFEKKAVLGSQFFFAQAPLKTHKEKKILPERALKKKEKKKKFQKALLKKISQIFVAGKTKEKNCFLGATSFLGPYILKGQKKAKKKFRRRKEKWNWSLKSGAPFFQNTPLGILFEKINPLKSFWKAFQNFKGLKKLMGAKIRKFFFPPETKKI